MSINDFDMCRPLRHLPHSSVFAEWPQGPGNARNRYVVMGAPEMKKLLDVNFQNGPIPVNGVNGVQIEDLLAICQDRLEGFQTGQFPHPANEVAIEHIKAAIASLDSRTAQRTAQGIAGQHVNFQPLG